MKKSLYYVLAAMFIIPLSGLIPIRGTDIWYVQYLGFTAVLLFGISLYLWDWNKFVSIFTMLALISALVVSKQHPRSLFMLINIDIGCLVLKYLSTQWDNRKIIIKCLLWLIALQCIWVVVQYFNLDPFFDNINSALPDDTVGISGSKNQLGLFMAVSLPIVMTYCVYLIPLVVFALMCSKTSSAVVGAIVGVVFYLYSTKNAYRHIALIGIVLLSLLFMQKFETYSKIEFKNRYLIAKNTISQVETERIKITKHKKETSVTKVIACNKWFGYGIGNFMRYSPSTQDYTWGHHVYRHVHNDFIEMWFEMGRLGLISILIILGNIVWLFARKSQETDVKMLFSCLIIYVVTANGIFTMHTAVSLMLFTIIFGLLVGGLNGKAS